jgi:peroxiredoxin
MGTPAQVAQFRESFRLPFLCLSDVDRIAYRAYDLPRARFRQVAGPQLWLTGFKAVLSEGIGRSVGDPLQLQGCFVIDRAGIVRFAHRAADAADRPASQEILRVLERLHEGA